MRNDKRPIWSQNDPELTLAVQHQASCIYQNQGAGLFTPEWLTQLKLDFVARESNVAKWPVAHRRELAPTTQALSPRLEQGDESMHEWHGKIQVATVSVTAEPMLLPWTQWRADYPLAAPPATTRWGAPAPKRLVQDHRMMLRS
jgi:hypothetical protein